jgi:hypothetical protein
MAPFCERSLVLFLVLFILSACGAPKVECDSSETRKAVLDTISNDHNNALAAFAAKNSSAAKDVEKSINSESAKPSYLLGEKIVTTSISANKATAASKTRKDRNQRDY